MLPALAGGVAFGEMKHLVTCRLATLRLQIAYPYPVDEFENQSRRAWIGRSISFFAFVFTVINGVGAIPIVIWMLPILTCITFLVDLTYRAAIYEETLLLSQRIVSRRYNPHRS